eukprot:TRINITY_DN1369_c5_g1_i1.p1 TRINITY_DN1369_c5_g1~~TRINITY_DN1369_c5_g1_i1.p1  ORF type:complete len:1113 (+),score=252.80 TRINITY_DN1369_c5_g1_i1:287-3340(+)
MDNAEQLGSRMMEQTVQVVQAKMAALFDTPQLVVEQIIRFLSKLGRERLSDRKVWDESIGPWALSLYKNAHKRGVTELQVSLVLPTVDGVDGRRGTIFLEDPRTFSNPADAYHALLVVGTAQLDCQMSYSRNECEANGCPWCTSDTGGAGHCGIERRKDATRQNWLPCRTGFSPPADYPRPWYTTAATPYIIAHPTSTGNPYIGSCGLDMACACAAFDDYWNKNGSHVGVPGAATYNSELPIRGSYRRPDGTYPPAFPAPGSVPASEVLESGMCPLPVSLSGASTLDGRQLNCEKEDLGKILWAPVGAGTVTPLLNVRAYSTYTVPGAENLPRPQYVTGYGFAGIDVARVSLFMLEADLPAGSRMYAVQTNPFRASHIPCTDDRHRLVSYIGYSCPLLVSILGLLNLDCESDLHDLSKSIGRFNFMWDHCPVTCNRCPTLNDTVGDLIGATHGATSTKVPLNISSYARYGLHDLRPRHIFDSDDNVTRTNAMYIMQQPGHFTAFDSQTLHKWVDDDGLLWWMKVRNFDVGDSPDGKLRLHLVLLVKRDEALKDIDAATLKTQQQINQSVSEVLSNYVQSNRITEANVAAANKKAGDDKDDAFLVMYIVVAACVAVLMVVSVVFVNLIVAPLLVLQGEMADVATMDLEKIDRERPPSALGEVAEMQGSFLQMVSNLIEYRNYMPASILVGDEEEEEEEDSPEGDRSTEERSRANSKPSMAEMSSVTGSRRESRKSGGSAETRGTVQSKMLAAQKRFGGPNAELKKKQVSLCVVSLRGFHELMRTLTGAKLSEVHGEFLSKAVQHITGTKGLPDTFSGDRLLGSYNAVKHCASSKVQAVAAIVHLIPELEALGLTVSTSCVAGELRIGNMGCPGMKRFTFVGPVFSLAWAAERVAQKLDVKNVSDKGVLGDAAGSYYSRTVAWIQYPKKGKLLLSEMLRAKTVSEDEWMYQLEEGDKANPCRVWNEYCCAVWSSNFGEAANLQPSLDQQGSEPVPPALLTFYEDMVLQGTSMPLLVTYH